MEFKGTKGNYLEKLLNKKAEKDNSIDLNAYALGIKDSKAVEMLEMLKNLVSNYNDVLSGDYSNFLLRSDIDKSRELIKEATEI